MKIKSIHYRGYYRFDDLSLDLTYPQGHKKAGKPLDKICIIGQSGTGKTTILKSLTSLYDKSPEPVGGNVPAWKEYENNFDIDIHAKFSCSSGEDEIKRISKLKNKRYLFSKGEIVSLNFNISQDKPGYFFFPAEFIDIVNSSIGSKPIENPLDYISTKEEIRKKTEDELHGVEKGPFNFETEDFTTIWKLILRNAREYAEKELSYSHKITQTLIKGTQTDADALVAEFKQWQKHTPNPHKKIASYLNPLLTEFHLKVVDEVNFEKKEDLEFIQIKEINGTNGNTVPYSVWSTGTKQLVLTTAPLGELPTKNTMILIDEPERSLYPNMQRLFIPHLVHIAPKAQLIVATHSPVIASEFEPWEIIELEYDKNGKIIQKEPLLEPEKERTVDNYRRNPAYLRWDQIFSSLFNLSETGGKERDKALTRILTLTSTMKKLQNEDQRTSDAYKKLYEEFLTLSHKTGWGKNAEN